MKTTLSFLLLILFYNLSHAQEAIVPGVPCTGSNYDATQYLNTTVTLKVLLVEFSDIKHQNPVQNPGKSEYTISNFNNLLFSSGTYVSPSMYSPDSKQVFGSLHDYYDKMSNGNLNISGNILNNDANSDGIPDWISLDNSKTFYNDRSYVTFYNDAISKASLAGINIGTLDTYTKLVIIYSGHAYRSSALGLNPRANYIGGTWYIMSEQFAPYAPYDSEHSSRSFSHIGIHAHELGHLLGLPDLYYNENNNGYWDLMGSGNYEGPEFAGECPAPISPILRYDKGWLTNPTNIEDITTNRTNLQLNYFLQNSKLYKVANSSNSNNYFLFETRSFNSTMQIGNNTCSDYNTYLPHGNQTQGIIIWRIDNYAPQGRIIHASGENWIVGGVQGNEGDVIPGPYQRFSIGPNSDTRDPSQYASDGRYQNWVPNTKPSTNVAMEITGVGSNTYTVNLYYSNPPAEGIKSSWQLATAKNGQRKIVQDASGNYHIVFSSGGEIFYRKNVSGTWQNPVKLSYVNDSNDFPCITVGYSNSIMVVWQRNTGTNVYDIYY